MLYIPLFYIPLRYIPLCYITLFYIPQFYGVVVVQFEKYLPQGLKPLSCAAAYGTAEAVPLSKTGTLYGIFRSSLKYEGTKLFPRVTLS